MDAAESTARLYREATANVEQAAAAIDMDPKVRQILSSPMSELIINFPVQRDDGVYELLQGYRIQHNNVLGPHPGLSNRNSTISASTTGSI